MTVVRARRRRAPWEADAVDRDAVTLAPALARVLALQRGAGNRATAHLLHPERPTLARALRGKKGVVSGANGHKLTEGEARELLAAIARGDHAPLMNLENRPLINEVDKNAWKDDDMVMGVDHQEWGLIREFAGECHLIVGGPGGVQWAPYLTEGEPIAHSHPWQPGKKRSTRTEAQSIDDLLAGNSTDENDTLGKKRMTLARTMVFPTISDFVFPAEQGQTSHTVFTPYVFDDDNRVRDPQEGDGAGRRLIWELSEIQLRTTTVRGRLTATAGNDVVWSVVVEADKNNLHGTDYTRVVDTPAKGCCILF
jgi:hypothetical protein